LLMNHFLLLKTHFLLRKMWETFLSMLLSKSKEI
jgi:hypothetical protein